MPLVIETFQEFATRNGDDAIEIGEQLVFSNGATANIEDGKLRREPPTNENEILNCRKRYTLEKVKRVEQEFLQTRSSYSEQAAQAMTYPNLGPPNDGAIEHLKHLKDIVQKHRGELQAIETEIENTDAGQRRKAQAAQRQKRSDAIRSIHGKIRSVVLDDEPEKVDEISKMILEASAKENEKLREALLQ